MRRRRRPSRLWGLAAIWVVVTASVALVPGCFEKNCEGTTEFYGKNPGEGRLIDENSWESSAVGGRWLDFPHQRFWDFDLRALGDREPRIVIPYLSGNPEPNRTNDNSVIGAGNIAEISVQTPGRVVIHNGTCADYFLRLVVVAEPKAPSLGDGGTLSTTSEGGAADAGDAGDAARD